MGQQPFAFPPTVGGAVASKSAALFTNANVAAHVAVPGVAARLRHCQDRCMASDLEQSIAEFIQSAQFDLAGRGMTVWAVEAQLQAIDDRILQTETQMAKRVGEGKFLAIGAVGLMSLSIACAPRRDEGRNARRQGFVADCSRVRPA